MVKVAVLTAAELAAYRLEEPSHFMALWAAEQRLDHLGAAVPPWTLAKRAATSADFAAFYHPGP